MSNHDSFGQYKFLGLVSRNVHLILTFESVLHEKNSVRRLMTKVDGNDEIYLWEI